MRVPSRIGRAWGFFGVSSSIHQSVPTVLRPEGSQSRFISVEGSQSQMVLIEVVAERQTLHQRTGRHCLTGRRCFSLRANRN